MKKTIIFFFIFYSATILFAQNRAVDSLKQLLPKEKTDTGKINLLISMGSKFGFGRARNDSALWYLQQALEWSQKANYAKGEIRARFNMTSYLFQTGNYPEALKLGLYNLKEAERFNDLETLFLQTRVVGWIYGRMGDKNKHLEYEKKLAPLAPLIPVKDATEKEEFVWIANNVLAMAYSELNMQDSALHYLQIVYESGLRMRDHAKIALATYGLGNYYLRNGNDSLAFFYFRECLPNAINSGRLDGVVNAETAIARIFFNRGQSDSALSYAGRALSKVQIIDGPNAMQKVYSLLSELYSSRHQYDSAYKYEHYFGVLKDSLFNQTKITQAQNFSFNETLQQQQLEQAKKEAQQQYVTKIKFYILAAVIAAFSIIAFLLLRNTRNNQRANKLLQQKNEEIESALSNLKSTQAQLIQSEKMASLGELTAGIAHEIQNPLNFVNNFSEINKEMLEELKAERLKPGTERDETLQDEIINDVMANSEKINHHGRRADAIVKGMLQHSRGSSGVKEPTDINALCDEYLRLAYHVQLNDVVGQGLRAKDESFNPTLKTNFDDNVGEVNVIPQDIGKVLLNIINNAFYACAERARIRRDKQSLQGFQNPKDLQKAYVPIITLVTRKENDKVTISIQDNGNGIPDKIKDKIFQPFFTTKPSGSGTGLGLSLAYDIVKAYGGEIKVTSETGTGTVFKVVLPV